MQFEIFSELGNSLQLGSGGKPSTLFPPGWLVELLRSSEEETEKETKQEKIEKEKEKWAETRKNATLKGNQKNRIWRKNKN